MVLRTMIPKIDAAIARGIAYAPYADLIWCETSKPDLGEAKKFAEAVRKEHPEQMLAYNCSPSFNWARHMDEGGIDLREGFSMHRRHHPYLERVVKAERPLQRTHHVLDCSAIRIVLPVTHVTAPSRNPRSRSVARFTLILRADIPTPVISDISS